MSSEQISHSGNFEDFHVLGRRDESDRKPGWIIWLSHLSSPEAVRTLFAVDNGSIYEASYHENFTEHGQDAVVIEGPAKLLGVEREAVEDAIRSFNKA